MVQGSSDQKHNNEQASLFQAFVPAYPFRHKSYNSALDAIQSTLEHKNAVILQGAERTGKSTLIEEIKQIYQQKGIEVISFTSAVNTPRQLYSLMAEALHVPKLKKDLVSALMNARNTGKYCLVVMDEAAVNSSAATSEAMRKLCDPNSKTAGAIKVIVVCTDYLVIHTKNTYETDFHDWIKSIVPLHALKAEELEALTHYLAGLKHCSTPQFETGTDIELIERSKGKIDQLISLINPLIDEAVINQDRFQSLEQDKHPLDSSKSKYYFLGAASVLVFLISFVMKSIIIPSPGIEEKTSNSDDAPIFKSELNKSADVEASPVINPPSLGTAKEKVTSSLPEKLLPSTNEPEALINSNSLTQTTVQKAYKIEPDIKLLDEIPFMIDNWIKARRERNIEEYLAFYSTRYIDQIVEGKIWRDKVTSEFQKDKLLHLKRTKLDLETTDHKTVRVEFWLDQINTKGSQSRIKKRLVLNYEGDSWKIANDLELRQVTKQ
ncbi:MAG: ATP-binding protein [Neptuniibacter sp.]